MNHEEDFCFFDEGVDGVEGGQVTGCGSQVAGRRFAFTGYRLQVTDGYRKVAMCTMIVERVTIDGSGKGREGWFELTEANVSYDHPFNAPLEHALNIDFVNEAQGPGARVAVELSAEAARSLVETIMTVLGRAEAGGHIEH